MNYLTDQILNHTFNIIFEYIIKKHETLTDNPPIRTYINKIENRITFKIKRGYYLELLTPESMELIGSIKSKITENKNGKNVPHLEITEVVLVHCTIVTYTCVPYKSFGQLPNISPKNSIFLKTFNLEFPYILKYDLLIKTLNRYR